MDGFLTSLFTTIPGDTVSTPDLLLRLLVSFLAATAVGWFYSWSHGSLSYSQNYVQSLVLLAMVVCMVLTIVGDSLARAFGLGAALAIVRFRTPIKDSKDAVFLFLAVAVGMAAGTGMLGVALGSAAVIGITSMYLSWSAYGTRSLEEGVLRLHFQGDEAGREHVLRTIQKHCSTFHLSAARQSRPGGPQEYVYDVNLRNPNVGDTLVRDLVGTEGVSGVSLLPLARVGEA